MPLQNDGTLTRNYVEKSLNNLLEYVSVGSKEKSDSGLETFYQLTLDAIEKDGNEVTFRVLFAFFQLKISAISHEDKFEFGKDIPR